MPEKSEYVPTNSISILQEKALVLIGSRSDGVFQSDLRRLLSIDSSKCSKVVTRMQSSGLIYREKVPASSTYLLKLVHRAAAAASEEFVPAGAQLNHIDSYLTEIYLLYLVRGISS
jgi:DNA-binding MarR family transcriptional regulator